MGAFHQNKAFAGQSPFHNCSWKPNMVESNTDSAEIAKQWKETIFSDCGKVDNKCESLDEYADRTRKRTKKRNEKTAIYQNDDQDCLICEKTTVRQQTKFDQGQIADNTYTNEAQRGLRNGSNIVKSTMQIMEDHLLLKVSIRRLYGGIYLYNGKYYAPMTEQEYSILLRRKTNEGILSILKNYRAFSDAYHFLASNPDIEFEDFNKLILDFKTVIAFDNILLDAKTGERYEHDQNYPIFFGTNIHYSDKPEDTPYWDMFVESISQGDKKIKKLIYEMLGYLLLQGNDGKCFFVLAAASNSGKSVLGDFISSIFSDCYVSHMAIDDFGKRFSLGGLWRTVLNVSMDLPQSTLSTDTVSLIKTLTGDSKITAEEKYAPKFTALNHVKLVFGTNSRISISTPDSAFWNRVIIVPFQHEIPRPQRDPDLLTHLLDEKDDIFSKCIPYVMKLIEQNYEFTMPDISYNMKYEWSGNGGDSIGDFFSEYCDITEDASGIAVQELYGFYKEYCSHQKVADTISDAANFSKVVRQRYSNIETKKCRIKGYDNPVSVLKNVKCSYDQNIMKG